MQKLDDFLHFNDRKVLTSHGTVSRDAANEHAHREYELFAAERRSQKEADGARQLAHDLENIAKQLPVRKKRKT